MRRNPPKLCGNGDEEDCETRSLDFVQQELQLDGKGNKEQIQRHYSGFNNNNLVLLIATERSSNREQESASQACCCSRLSDFKLGGKNWY
jgi:hypothetical protein